MSHFCSLFTSRPAVLLAINESIMIFLVPFMPLPFELISSANTRSWFVLFNLNPSWFAYSFMTVYHRANLKAMAIKNWNDWNAVILHTVRITYVWHDGTTVISRLYEWKFSEICSLQAYYTAYSDNSVPTFRGGITTVRCIISQKGADLMYINAESWNHNKFSDFCFFMEAFIALSSNFLYEVLAMVLWHIRSRLAHGGWHAVRRSIVSYLIL